MPQLELITWYNSSLEISYSIWVLLIIVNIHIIYISSYNILLNENIA